MLKSLNINSFALIDKLNIAFGQGLNILTGETGAGKSIIIDAFSMVLGNRAAVDLIRTGCDSFLVEAVFDVLDPTLRIIVEEQHIVLEEDVLIISRRFNRNGKNSVLINGHHVTLAVLKVIGQKLVDIHGQHENQALLRVGSHLILLDSFDIEVVSVHDEYSKMYRDWSLISKEISSLEQNSRELIQRQDMLQWQTEEIAAAALYIGEDEAINQEIKILANAEKIAANLQEAYSLLGADDAGDAGIITKLGKAKRNIEYATRYDQKLEASLNMINETIYGLSEVMNELRQYLEEVDFNPQRLSVLQQRMDTIYKLKTKYGATVADILEYQLQAVTELQNISNKDEQLAALQEQQGALYSRMCILAEKLSALRQNAAQKLSNEVTEQLRSLSMPQANFVVQISKNEYNLHGCDDAVFLFSANKGEALKPLVKVASGGELSRIALAIKAVCSQHDVVSTMVFDEVDAGIGGQTAEAVAEKIAMVANSKQVICITHLPQIACMADQHFYIEKQDAAERVNSVVYELTPEKRLDELARMISGSQAMVSSRKTANEMIFNANIKKKKYKNEA